MPYQVDIRQIYKTHEILGEGVYGVAYRATRLIDGKEFVIKKLIKSEENFGSKETAGSKQVVDSFIREYTIYTNVNHINIPKLIDWSFDKDYLYIVFPLYKNWDYKSGRSVEGFISDIFSAVICLHDNGILHGDLKIDNVVYDEKMGKYLIIDFGISRYAYQFSDLYMVHGIVNADQYRDPEYKIDVKYKNDDIKTIIYNDIKTELYSIAILIVNYFFLSKLGNRHSHYKLTKLQDKKIDAIISDLTKSVDFRNSLREIAIKHKIPITQGTYNRDNSSLPIKICSETYITIIDIFNKITQFKVQSAFVFLGVQLFKMVYHCFIECYLREPTIKEGFKLLMGSIYISNNLYYNTNMGKIKVVYENIEYTFDPYGELNVLLHIMILTPESLHPYTASLAMSSSAEELKQFLPTFYTCNEKIPKLNYGGNTSIYIPFYKLKNL